MNPKHLFPTLKSSVRNLQKDKNYCEFDYINVFLENKEMETKCTYDHI